MDAIDIVLGLILLLFFAFGFKKGLISTIFNLLTFVCAFVVIGRFGPIVQASMMNKFNLEENPATISTYVLIFIFIFILFKIISYFANKLVNILHLGFANHLMGGILGTVNGIILYVITSIVINLFPFAPDIWQNTKNSYIVKYVRLISSEAEDKILDQIPQPDLDKINQLKESL